MKKSILIIMMSLAIVWGAGSAAQAGIIGSELNALLQSLGPDEEVAVIVSLADKADLKEIKDLDKAQKRSKIIKALKDKSDKTQKDLKTFLKQKKAQKVVSYWIFNGLAATVKASDIAELAGRPEVKKISLDGKIKAPQPTPAAPDGTPEWNIDAIQAPVLWNSGFIGSGVVVASMDTGVDVNHADLSTGWRGGNNSWYDPNGQHATPYDYSGHGTQVMGVIVGGDAGGTSIGVAPDAHWIAVKIFNDAGVAEYRDIHAGFQWLLDPDDNPSTNDAPDVVNNSWGYAESLVNSCFTEFEADIQVLRAADIAVVFSSGNSGPNSSTSESPANYPGSFAVGAVDQSMGIADFSGRGTSACDDTIYPEVVAPGVSVRTSNLGNGYQSVTGTSIAAPHVSGAIALLAGAFPNATVSELESALKGAAVDLGAAGPDNDHGYGLIDVVAAEGWLADSPPPDPDPVCSDTDSDGFFADVACGTELDCNDGNADINPDACDIKGDGIDQDCDGKDRTKGKACPGSGDDGGGDPGDTTEPEGKGKTCTDGIDNDGDGQTDCDDSGCAKNKACK